MRSLRFSELRSVGSKEGKSQGRTGVTDAPRKESFKKERVSSRFKCGELGELIRDTEAVGRTLARSQSQWSPVSVGVSLSQYPLLWRSAVERWLLLVFSSKGVCSKT